MHQLSKRLVLLVALAACSRGSSGTVTFGAAGPEGDANGQANRRGIELAQEELNSAPNRPFELKIEFRNDSSKGATAAAIAKGFVDSAKIVAVVGHVGSGAMMAAAHVYDGHLPAVATAATSPILTGISRWTFRVISSDSANGLQVANFMSQLGRKRAAVLYENNAYGRGLADSFRNGFTALGGAVLSFDPISDHPTESLEPFVTWFKQQHVDLVFVAGTGNSAVAFLKEARRQQIAADLASGNGWSTVVGNPLADGAYFATPFNPDDPRPEVKTFVAAYRRRYNNEVPTGNAALGYDATKLLAEAVGKVGPDRAKIRDYLAHLPAAYHGVTGAITFGPDGDPKDKPMTMVRIQGGQLRQETSR
jgi:branched-chain amino acid transport system substrate-binding protein